MSQEEHVLLFYGKSLPEALSISLIVSVVHPVLPKFTKSRYHQLDYRTISFLSTHFCMNA